MKPFFVILILVTTIYASAIPPKHEIRGAWITTAWRLDWPRTIAKDTISITKQKQELTKILDQLQFLNFNTVFLQIRMRNDVIYTSKYEPWSSLLSGKSGKCPGYDPLKFAIDECHKRGLECHGWMVSIPIGSNKQIKELGKTSLTYTNPDLCKRIANEWFLDPGNPKTSTYLASLAAEVVRNYDIDGIHLDYIRYPENGIFPDSDTFVKYGSGKNIADWRRSNINRVVYTIYDSIKTIKPWVQLSSSPIGKYNDLDTLSSKGWNGYTKVSQDPKAWLKAGKQDFIVPMMYFKEPIFKPFMNDWKKDSEQRPVTAGIALYMLTEHDWPIEIIEREIKYSREISSGGQTFFRTDHLMKNTKFCTDIIKSNTYIYPALMPPMTWISNTKPAAPKNLNVCQVKNKLVFNWSNPSKMDQLSYNIYIDSKSTINTGDVRNLIACRIKTNRYEMEIPDDFSGSLYFGITSCNRFHNESSSSESVLIRFSEQASPSYYATASQKME